MTGCLGFRIVGPCTGERRLVDWLKAFTGYASLDHRADVNHQAYLSAFTFGPDFGEYLKARGTTKGFDGACGADFIWFDIDRPGLEAARRDAARLCHSLVERFGVDDEDLLIWFSGAKGFHIGLPTAVWGPLPSLTFNRAARRFAEGLAAGAKVEIDLGTYAKVQAFRAPNSRHAKSGLHKRHLSLHELTRMSVERIQVLAAAPQEFDLPEPTTGNTQASTDWQAAVQAVDTEKAAQTERFSIGEPLLNRSTLEFMHNGANTGDRHRLLFSAAANLAEFGCPAGLAHQLLTQAALDSGLSPSDTRRQIECGLSRINRGHSSK